MDEHDSPGLLKTVLGFFARKRPERSAQPASLRSRTRDAWLRTDAYLQLDTDGFGEIDPEPLARTLRALEDYLCAMPFTDTFAAETYAATGRGAHLSL